MKLTSQMDVAFEDYRRRTFGAYAEYPLEAYTSFGAGWKAAMARAAEIVGQKRQSLTNGGAINACKSIAASLKD